MELKTKTELKILGKDQTKYSLNVCSLAKGRRENIKICLQDSSR
jgi:hypothetical protein